MRVDQDTVWAAMAAVQAEKTERAGGKLNLYFPKTGPFRRSLYPKHMAFFAAGKQHRERGAISANRVGKSVMGAFETTLHLTGLYPDWWLALLSTHFMTTRSIVLDDYLDPVLESQAQEFGAIYLVKPVDPFELTTQVSSIATETRPSHG